MRPGRANLRAAGGGAAGGGAAADAPAAAPSAEYNNRLCLESRYAASLALLHSHLSTDANGVVMEAAILLKTWARQRSIGQAGCVSPISHASPLDLPWISHVSPLYLPCMSHASPPYLPIISPISPL